MRHIIENTIFNEEILMKLLFLPFLKMSSGHEQLSSLVAGPSEEQKKNKAIDFLLSSTLKSKMEELITKESPDFIICTHAFPSYLVNELKQEGKSLPPVFNVYTDFFINDIWGRKYIDYHFVSSEEMESTLIKKNSSTILHLRFMIFVAKIIGGKDLVTDITNEPDSARKIKEILNNERLRKKQHRKRKKFVKDNVNPTQVLLKVAKGSGNIGSEAN
jgi:UDP-N-acetylglucosamine:LPS N-acetylglucosamine transferase